MKKRELPEEISFADAQHLVIEGKAKYWNGVNPYLLYFDETGKAHTYIKLSMTYIKLD
jgi:hypothetical protein